MEERLESLADDVLVLTTTPDRAENVRTDFKKLYPMVAGGDLLRLVGRRRISVDGGRIFVLDNSGTGDAVLDLALASIEKSRKAPRLKKWLDGGPRHKLFDAHLERLCDSGTISDESIKVLRFIPWSRYRLVDTARASSVKERLYAIAHTGPADVADVALAGFIWAVDLDRTLYPGRELKSTRSRFKEIGSSPPSSSDDDSAIGVTVRAVIKGVRDVAHAPEGGG